MNTAVILAGGSGSRLGSDVPKQFLEVCGKSIMEYSIEAFETHPQIDRIIIVIKEEYIPSVYTLIERNQYKKISDVISGGKERYESSIFALQRSRSDDETLLFHDCARPMVSHRIISDCIRAMQTYDAVSVAIKTSDTIYVTNSDGNITSIPPRTSLLNAQTPQCFKASVIRSAYDKALQDPEFLPTDDCSVVFRYLPEIPIQIVAGETSNIKITYKEDLLTMTRLIEGHNE